MSLQLPLDTPASSARRRSLYETWESAETIIQELPDLETLACDGRVLAVWVREKGEHRYPGFQFNLDRQPIPQMKPLLHLLRGPNGLTDEANQAGWLEVEWLYAPHVLLEGSSPAEILPHDPERVLAAAREEFGKDHQF
ncbi:hypothetical protein H4F99_12540 [Lysobacter sp. SG-8]|uniref:Uncharacterized protein n=1 Tax=Marilutibacter penaei TaxID=2759900 RepID=A0A7W3U5G6_9GAMM|nr:hypothetical protein [Lysobacter penaei]MBB1089307.1 hypothetical protein [Lysobacter penaei]